MGYNTPPALDPSVSGQVATLRNAVVKNINSIKASMIQKAISASGIETPKINVNALVQYIDTVIGPTIQKWEGGWGEHPNDSGGPTMRGVILSTLIGSFKKLFVDSSISEVSNAAKAWNNQHPNWTAGPASQNMIGKQLLYELCGEHEISRLFVYKFLCSKDNNYPIAMMTEDPFLGYFLMDCCWGSGPGCYKSNGFFNLAREYGWSGENFAKFVTTLGDKSPEFAVKCLQKRVEFILAISQPGSKNNVFRKGWMNRTVNNSNSQLAMVIITNEIFNLNTKKLFKFTPAEEQHLLRKAEIYKTLEITLPI